VKLTDFGVAPGRRRQQRWFRPQVANPKILTPELVTLGYTTTQSDLYQLGLLMFQMITGQSAMDATRPLRGARAADREGYPAQVKAEALGTPHLGVSRVVTAKMLRRRDGHLATGYQSAREVWDRILEFAPTRSPRCTAARRHAHSTRSPRSVSWQRATARSSLWTA
jgi:serine/threonine protein kinase